MFGGLGLGELVVIFLIVLVIFGAKRIPEIGQGLGKGIANFRKAVKEEDKTAAHIEDDNSENNHDHQPKKK